MNLYLCRQTSYDVEAIKPHLSQMLEEISEQLSTPKKILIKLNLLMKATPDKNITTHPAVAQALSELLIERGHEVILADSPGGPMHENRLRAIYETSGMKQVAQKSGAQLNYSTASQEVYSPTALRLKRFQMLSVIREAEVVINLAKCKTHGMMTYTGAVKNLFGVIPGLTKASYHLKMQEPMHFAHHLIDVASEVHATFHIIDCIEAMEGNGPSSGVTRKLGILAGSCDPFTLDACLCGIIGIGEEQVPTLRASRERHLIQSKLHFPVQRPEEFSVVPFLLPDSQEVTFLPSWVPEALRHQILSRLRARPRFLHPRCIGCSKCAEICPAQIIHMIDQRPFFDRKRCISCFCCHEICPVQAISIQRS